MYVLLFSADNRLFDKIAWFEGPVSASSSPHLRNSYQPTRAPTTSHHVRIILVSSCPLHDISRCQLCRFDFWSHATEHQFSRQDRLVTLLPVLPVSRSIFSYSMILPVNLRFSVQPAAIAFPITTRDVSTIMQIAQKFNNSVVARSDGSLT